MTTLSDSKASETPLLEVRNLVKEYPTRQAGKVVHACSDISVTLRRGETLGVIGESGSGKTTFGRCVLRLVEPTSGEILFEGRDLTGFGASDLRKLRDDMQIVFQEPFDSLNPQMTIGRQVAEPLRIHTDMSRSERAARSLELLAMVGLPANVADRLPRALTPGALQRASIARAIATDPKLIVLDEPTSALSPESEVEIIRLLQDLQERLGLAYIFISHDLSLVGAVSDQVAVMYLSEVVETGPRDRVFSNPRHPYSHALLGSVLLPYYSDTPAERKTKLDGEIPSPIDLPPGCYLASRCMHANDVCRTERQVLTPVDEPNHLVRCHRVIKGEI
jgi:oligopeptide/dipeptide ABC transporter ATP-binding protein